jgi:hypothetical protein
MLRLRCAAGLLAIQPPAEGGLWAPAGIELQPSGDGLEIRHAPDWTVPELLNLYCSSWLPASLAAAGALVLRGSAVRGPRGALLLLGGAMSGKSLLAAQLIRAGWTLLSDDVVVLRSADQAGALQVEAGLPWIKLWGASPVGTDLGPWRQKPVSKRRWHLPMQPEACPLLGTVVLLGNADVAEPQLARLPPAAALDVLAMLQRRPARAPAPSELSTQFRLICALSRKPVWRLHWPGDGDPARSSDCLLRGMGETE